MPNIKLKNVPVTTRVVSQEIETDDSWMKVELSKHPTKSQKVEPIQTKAPIEQSHGHQLTACRKWTNYNCINLLHCL